MIKIINVFKKYFKSPKSFQQQGLYFMQVKKITLQWSLVLQIIDKDHVAQIGIDRDRENHEQRNEEQSRLGVLKKTLIIMKKL